MGLSSTSLVDTTHCAKKTATSNEAIERLRIRQRNRTYKQRQREREREREREKKSRVEAKASSLIGVPHIILAIANQIDFAKRIVTLEKQISEMKRVQTILFKQNRASSKSCTSSEGSQTSP